MSRMKDNELLQMRSTYVKYIVEKAPCTHEAVKKLGKKLFLSERTIYRDLAK